MSRTIFVNQDDQILRNNINDIQRKNSLLDFPMPTATPNPGNSALLRKSLTSPEKVATRKSTFYLFLYVVIFTNYDTGVIPAALFQIKEELELNFTQQALLGSLPNFGISFASFFVSYGIAKLRAKVVLSAALILNIGICILFALSKNLWAMYISRYYLFLRFFEIQIFEKN